MKNAYANEICTYYLVQLGTLFYAGGLKRYPINKENVSLEFVKNERVAFPFIAKKEYAKEVAQQCGGTVVERSALFKEVMELKNENEQYKNSGDDEW